MHHLPNLEYKTPSQRFVHTIFVTTTTTQPNRTDRQNRQSTSCSPMPGVTRHRRSLLFEQTSHLPSRRNRKTCSTPPPNKSEVEPAPLPAPAPSSNQPSRLTAPAPASPHRHRHPSSPALDLFDDRKGPSMSCAVPLRRARSTTPTTRHSRTGESPFGSLPLLRVEKFEKHPRRRFVLSKSVLVSTCHCPGSLLRACLFQNSSYGSPSVA